jgi:transcription termination factor Rho
MLSERHREHTPHNEHRCMTERRRPQRRGRGPRSSGRTPAESTGEPNPYLDGAPEAPDNGGDSNDSPPPRRSSAATEEAPAAAPPPPPTASEAPATPREQDSQQAPPPPQREYREHNHRPQHHRGEHRHHHRDRDNRGGENGGRPNQQFNGNGRRNRRNRGRGRHRDQQHQQQPPTPVVADAETLGWFDPSRDGGFIRRAQNSYLAEPGDAYVGPHLVRQYGLRRGDTIVASTGRDHRGRSSVVELLKINDQDPATATRRPDFGSLTATYPERKLHLETGRPAKGGPELTRRAIDLIAPIGYGQRALIVAPARAGKTMLLHAITEGIAINHPNATLLILLVDERPEEVSEAISWGVGEVIASSFDQPADRHVEVTEMVLEHARRLVEMGKDVVIVLDSLTRMARAHNTAERGSGRTMSGGLDTTAMAKPKAFFGSARSVAAKDGGGSLTIISTALVETGSRMDDVIFEEFKGTGNCEIKLDRSLAEKRIFPAFDIATSGTRREEKLYKPEQLDAVYTLRRGLQQMPPQAAMEWMIKRIANTTNNDALLAGL